MKKTVYIIKPSAAVNIVYRLAVNTIGLGVASQLFKHVYIDSFLSLIMASVVLTVFNLLVKPVLTVLSIPLLIFTLGLFQIVVSGIVIMLVSWAVKGFYVDGLWVAIGVAIVVGIINLLFDILSVKKTEI